MTYRFSRLGISYDIGRKEIIVNYTHFSETTTTQTIVNYVMRVGFLINVNEVRTLGKRQQKRIFCFQGACVVLRLAVSRKSGS